MRRSLPKMFKQAVRFLLWPSYEKLVISQCIRLINVLSIHPLHEIAISNNFFPQKTFARRVIFAVSCKKKGFGSSFAIFSGQVVSPPGKRKANKPELILGRFIFSLEIFLQEKHRLSEPNWRKEVVKGSHFLNLLSFHSLFAGFS